MEEITKNEPPTAPGIPGGGAPKKAEKDLIAILSYLGILFLIPMLASKDNAFAQFHAKQGLVLFIAEVATGFLGAIPILGWFVILPIGSIIWFVLSIIGIVNVLGGKQTPLPIIGKFAGKFKF